ncbi:MAG: glycosyltransferase [Planctomycetota bacterium]
MTTIAVILFWVSALAIAYVLVGYPLCMAVLARRVSETGELPEAWPAVTLIIPAHNEEHVLQAKLENVQSIDYPRDKLRVIVGSDGSVDKTNAIAHRFIDAGIELFAFEARRGKASVLNDCV